MVSLDDPLDDISTVLSNYHIFEMGYPTIKPRLILPSNFDLIISESSSIGIDEPLDFSIELQVGVPYEYDLLCRLVDSLNDEFVPIDYAIDVNYDLPIEFDLIVCGSSIFCVDESLLVHFPKVMYTI